ncbi:MAG: hypothetical protein B7X95_04615 [Methylophilaceae bacterium 17-44-8]|nr:MAG: hypothetical protein B7X95_04615 [Methylophilaceae bacterium 17-44-8]
MRASTRKQNKNKRIKYSLFAVLSLLSFIAYTTHYYANKNDMRDKFATLAKPQMAAQNNQELQAPFAQRWNQVYAEVQDYLNDDDFKKARFFLDGEIVASNEVFELPTEETGAGLERYIQDLNDAVVADMVPNAVSGGGGSAGGFGGAGGGGGGGRDKNKQPPIITISGDPNNTSGETESNLSAVPAPPAIWLLGTALIGLMGVRRK